jgi:hypothetical protein
LLQHVVVSIEAFECDLAAPFLIIDRKLKSDGAYGLRVFVSVLVHWEALTEQLANAKRLFIHSRGYKLLHLYDLKCLVSGHLAEQLEKILAQDSQGYVQFEHWQICFDCDGV